MHTHRHAFTLVAELGSQGSIGTIANDHVLPINSPRDSELLPVNPKDAADATHVS